MSVTLNSAKQHARIAKTFVSHFEQFKNSNIPSEKEYASLLDDLFKTLTGNLKQDELNDPSIIEKTIYQTLLEANHQSYKSNYPDFYSEKNISSQLTKDRDLVNKLPKLSSLTLGTDHNDFITLQAELTKSLHGFYDDIPDESILTKLNQIHYSIAAMSVMTHPKIPESLDDKADLMMHLVSAKANGDSFYEIDSFMRNNLSKLDIDATYSSLSHRKLYGDQILAILADSHLGKDNTIPVFFNGMEIDERLPSLTSLTNKKISIQNDINDATWNSTMQVAKLLNEMNSVYQSASSDDFKAYGQDNEISSFEINTFKNNFNNLTQSHNYALSTNFDAFKKAFSSFYDHDENNNLGL